MTGNRLVYGSRPPSAAVTCTGRWQAVGRQLAMAAFGAWVGSVGDALADPGALSVRAMTVSADGVHPGAAGGRVAG